MGTIAAAAAIILIASVWMQIDAKRDRVRLAKLKADRRRRYVENGIGL